MAVATVVSVVGVTSVVATVLAYIMAGMTYDTE